MESIFQNFDLGTSLVIVMLSAFSYVLKKLWTYFTTRLAHYEERLNALNSDAYKTIADNSIALHELTQVLQNFLADYKSVKDELKEKRNNPK